MFGSMGGILFVILSLTFFQYCSGDCPSGWRAHEYSCYLYFHEPYTFFEAKVTCDIAEAYLIEIDSEQENLFAKSVLDAERGNNLWMGLDDFVEEGKYRWAHSKTEPEYYNWMAGDPNDWHHEEDCVAMEANNATWYDFDCEHKYPFMCEIEAEEGLIG